MKRFTIVFCLFVLFINTGCIKSLLKDKDEEEKPTDKYAGTWTLTAGGADENGNRVFDANERTTISGSSQLTLNKDLSGTYFINVGGASENMSGKWAFNGKSITLSNNNDAIRFDIQSDKELHSEPFSSNGTTVWLVYAR